MQVSSRWLEQCLEYLNRAGPWSLEVSKLTDYVYSCFLDFDLHLSKGSNSILPANTEARFRFTSSKAMLIVSIEFSQTGFIPKRGSDFTSEYALWCAFFFSSKDFRSTKLLIFRLPCTNNLVTLKT